MEELRLKGKNSFKKFFTKEQNIIIFEKNIYESTLNSLKKYENLEDIYIFNIYQFINEYNIDKNNGQELLKEIKSGKIHWQHNYYKDLINKQAEQDNFLINPIEIEEGVLECKCGSKRVISYQQQLRGADEPSTTFAQCSLCSFKWVYNG